jgi:hypothetical protein
VPVRASGDTPHLAVNPHPTKVIVVSREAAPALAGAIPR